MGGLSELLFLIIFLSLDFIPKWNRFQCLLPLNRIFNHKQIFTIISY